MVIKKGYQKIDREKPNEVDKTIEKQSIKEKNKVIILSAIAALLVIIIISFLMFAGNTDKNIDINITQNKNIFTSQNPQEELSAGKVIFFHANWCPHCQVMKPIVDDLIAEGYPIINAEVKSEIGIKVAVLYPNVHSIPTFICYNTNETAVGEKSKDALIAFINECEAKAKNK